MRLHRAGRDGASRGAVEHYFRARPRSYIGHQDWRKVPASLRDAVTGASLGSFFDRAADALESGTMDARDDTTLNWMPMAVDEAGWAGSRGGLRGGGEPPRGDPRALPQADRAEREEAIALVVGMAAFEPAPDGWVARPGRAVGGTTPDGAGADEVGEGEGAPERLGSGAHAGARQRHGRGRPPAPGGLRLRRCPRQPRRLDGPPI